jgi:rare lipoprotein A
VTNRDNGKQVIVQVNDYGPMASTGKIIDLDSVAFKKIGTLGQGVVSVKVEEILE